MKPKIFVNNKNNILIKSIWDRPPIQKFNICMYVFWGPVLPILTFDSLEKLLDDQKRRDKPLAFYYFTSDMKKAKRVMQMMPYGGGCINDCIMHMTSDSMPFGGVGRSGMGSYHGKQTFRTFSHQKSVLNKGKLEINLKYPPYSQRKTNLLERLAKIRKGQ